MRLTKYLKKITSRRSRSSCLEGFLEAGGFVGPVRAHAARATGLCRLNNMLPGLGNVRQDMSASKNDSTRIERYYIKPVCLGLRAKTVWSTV